MKNIPFKILTFRKFIKSLVCGYLKRHEFTNVKSFCMFIGYQRSGHSFLGALLDAHPEVSIGMEVDVLDLVDTSFNRNQIFFCIINNARIFTQKLKNIWTGYSYAVPNQYQGEYTCLRVIGDKKGGKSTLRLGENFTLYHQLQSIVKCPVKILHVIRNPFDNISTMILRHVPENSEPRRDDYTHKIELYFQKAKINSEIKQKKQIEIFDIYHEDFIAEPVKTLERIFLFLELNSSKDYLRDCSSIVFDNPHKSRFDLDWPDDLKKMVQSEINKYIFLKRYSFND